MAVSSGFVVGEGSRRRYFCSVVSHLFPSKYRKRANIKKQKLMGPCVFFFAPHFEAKIAKRCPLEGPKAEKN